MQTNLSKKLAYNGFESNDLYDYHVRCLLNSKTHHLRCLNVEGESGRHKTAFANALPRSLDFKHILYHDFTQNKDPIPKITLPDIKDDRGQKEIPIEALDRIVIEACAFSEAEPTGLILDQLQAADFREQIKIYNLVKQGQWMQSDVSYYANHQHLFIFLVSETPLYHSLQKISFKIWVNKASDRLINYKPADFGLGDEAWDLMQILANIFANLGITPTSSEYEKILHDIHTNIRHSDDLKHSIYGWTEGINREMLYHEELSPIFNQAITTIENYLGIDEIEISAIE